VRATRTFYTTHGESEVLNAGWSTTTDAYVWLHRFQGGRLETRTGIVHFRYRDYSTSLKTWMQPEPYGASYIDGENLYNGFRNNPVRYVDPLGLQTTAPASGTREQLMGDGSSVATIESFPGGGTHITITKRPPTAEALEAHGPLAEAHRQLALLQEMGRVFARKDKMWWPGYQCEEQAISLKKYIEDSDDWHELESMQKHLWQLHITGGAWKGLLRHNVVLLRPTNGNPLPPMILDAFHGPTSPFNKDCECITEEEFRRRYPQPVESPIWLKRIPWWRNIALSLNYPK
jgi:RHS repeat-associated protein